MSSFVILSSRERGPRWAVCAGRGRPARRPPAGPRAVAALEVAAPGLGLAGQPDVSSTAGIAIAGSGLG